MKDELVRYLLEYEKVFNERYPLEEVLETQDESIASIKKCLKENKPIKIDNEQDDY